MNSISFEASIGDRRLQANIRGLSLIRQRDTLRALVDAFFAEIDEEIGFELELVEEPISETFPEPTPEVIEMDTLELDPEELTDPRMMVGFSVDDLAKNYDWKNWETIESQIDVDTFSTFPDELQTAIKEGLGERSYKVGDNGAVFFQAYYICTSCSHRAKRFIPLGRKSLTCHDCGKRMPVRKAIEKDFPHHDTYGNMFISGEFMRRDEYGDATAREIVKQQSTVYLT